MTLDAGLFTSESDDYCSPTVVIVSLRKLGRIALDPCSNKHSIVPARVKLTRKRRSEAGSLAVAWLPYCYGGFAYVNPPYGRVMPLWAEKIVHEYKSGCEIVALVAARVDTRWWDTMIEHATAVCYWRGRITFVGRPGNGQPAKFPSAVLYFGPRVGAFCKAFGDRGRTYAIVRDSAISELREIRSAHARGPRKKSERVLESA